jgi:hypothetical protein
MDASTGTDSINSGLRAILLQTPVKEEERVIANASRLLLRHKKINTPFLVKM